MRAENTASNPATGVLRCQVLPRYLHRNRWLQQLPARALCYSPRVSEPVQSGAELTVEQLYGWKLIRRFQRELRRVLAARPPAARSPSENDPRRKLAAQDYFSLLLFALYNPVVHTLRGVAAASQFTKVQQQVCRHRVSVASFSEAQHLFDPALARALLRQLAPKASAVSGDPRLSPLLGALTAVDGTLFSTLPRMRWALRRDYVKRGAKLHVKFSVLRQNVLDAVLTPGKTCERAVLRAMLQPGEFYTADRYYGLDYGFFEELQAAGCDYAIRILQRARYTVERERPLRDQDRAAGLVWDGWVQLGAQGVRVRLVRIKAFDTELFIVTNRDDLEADLVGLIYRHRWQIETFFKWLKCVAGCQHLVLESPPGVASQLYCACILALLCTLATGRRPTLRDWEAQRWYLSGVATAHELQAALARPQKTK